MSAARGGGGWRPIWATALSGGLAVCRRYGDNLSLSGGAGTREGVWDAPHTALYLTEGRVTETVGSKMVMGAGHDRSSGVSRCSPTAVCPFRFLVCRQPLVPSNAALESGGSWKYHRPQDGSSGLIDRAD